MPTTMHEDHLQNVVVHLRRCLPNDWTRQPSQLAACCSGHTRCTASIEVTQAQLWPSGKSTQHEHPQAQHGLCA